MHNIKLAMLTIFKYTVERSEVTFKCLCNLHNYFHSEKLKL